VFIRYKADTCKDFILQQLILPKKNCWIIIVM